MTQDLTANQRLDKHERDTNAQFFTADEMLVRGFDFSKEIAFLEEWNNAKFYRISVGHITGGGTTVLIRFNDEDGNAVKSHIVEANLSDESAPVKTVEDNMIRYMLGFLVWTRLSHIRSQGLSAEELDARPILLPPCICCRKPITFVEPRNFDSFPSAAFFLTAMTSAGSTFNPSDSRLGLKASLCDDCAAEAFSDGRLTNQSA